MESTSGRVAHAQLLLPRLGQRTAEGEVDALGAAGGDPQPRVGERATRSRPARRSRRGRRPRARPRSHISPIQHEGILPRPAGSVDRRWTAYPRGVARSYTIRTYGCQMNVHDSERMAGLLEAAGYERSADRRRGRRRRVQHLRGAGERRQQALRQPRPPARRSRRPAPACRSPSAAASRRRTATTIVAQGALGRRRVRHPQRAAAARAARAGPAQRRPRRSRSPSRSRCSPPRCRRAASPRTRAGCRSRSAATTPAPSASSRRCAAPNATGAPATILAEVEALAADGVLEVTLLGQNVNAYGVEFGDRDAFAKLLRACGGVDGLERVRFTSPHPRDFTSDVIAAMAETPNVCPQLHMPLQSGSDDVLRRMRRSYRSARFLSILDEVRDRDPRRRDLHRHHRRVPRRDRGRLRRPRSTSSAPRGSPTPSPSSTRRGPAPPPPTLPDQLPKAVVQERYMRLVALQEEISWAAEPGARGPRRRGARRLGGGPQGRRHPPHERPGARRPAGALHPGRPATIRPGDVVRSRSTYGAPHHLVADGPVLQPPAHPRGRRARAARPAAHRARASRVRDPGARCRAGRDRVWRHPVSDRRRARAASPRSCTRSTQELAGAEKAFQRRTDPGATALLISVAMMILLVGPAAAVGRATRPAGRCWPGSSGTVRCRGCSRSPRSGSAGALGAGARHPVVGAGLAVRGRLRHLVDQRGVGDLVAADRRRRRGNRARGSAWCWPCSRSCCWPSTGPGSPCAAERSRTGRRARGTRRNMCAGPPRCA